MSILDFSIAREYLQGSIGNERFELRAYSGGGRGRLGLGAEHSAASYNFLRKEGNTAAGHVHGGPLPPGLYICHYVHHHATFGECVKLEQTITSLIQSDVNGPTFVNRDCFYIHGSGPHGSDGCIVVVDKPERHRLNKAVKNADSTVMLRVSEPGMLLPASLEARSTVA